LDGVEFFRCGSAENETHMSSGILGALDNLLVGTACCAAQYALSFEAISTIYYRFVAEIQVEVLFLALASSATSWIPLLRPVIVFAHVCARRSGMYVY
jgi:hypothetical protein